ncbi:MAG: glycosyltransferase family 4 protein, partial [Acidobacteriota bacterium]
MRVLILSTEFPPGPGGIGAHAFNLAGQLHARGASVRVLSPQDYVPAGEAEAWTSRQPFAVERLPHLPGAPLQGAWWALRLARALRRHRAEVLVATGQRAVWLAAACSRGEGLRLVAVGHGTEFGARRAWQRRLNARAFGAADLVISVSHFTRGFMLENGIEPARDAVIPNGADGVFFRPPMTWELEDFIRRHPFASGPLLVTVG